MGELIYSLESLGWWGFTPSQCWSCWKCWSVAIPKWVTQYWFL